MVSEGLSFWIDGNRHHINNWREDPALIPGSELWRLSNRTAPFDQEFYLTLGLGIGGRNDFASVNTPWDRTSPQMHREFYLAKDSWYPTWSGDAKALEIKSVKIFAL